MNSKKVLIHIIAFSPDAVSTAYLYNDIAKKLKKDGFEVVVLSTTPHYNIIKEELALQPLKRKFLGLYYISYYNDIKIYHVPQKKFKSTLWRITGFVYWHLTSFALGLFQKNVDCIISPSPPLTIGLVSIFLAKIKKAKSVYNVQEIYPDLIINNGKLKNKRIINFLKKIEKYVYDNSNRILTIDQKFYNTIYPRVNEKNKIKIIPNFVDNSVYFPIRKEDLKLDNKIFDIKSERLKLMYAGNIGLAQDWETLIELAKKTEKMPVDYFVIGEGVKKLELIKNIKKYDLENIKILDYVPRSQINNLINFADIHFIFMNEKMEDQGFPSKIYTIMACGKPILATSGENSPLFNFFQTNGLGDFVGKFKTLNKKVEFLILKIEEILKNKNLLEEFGTTNQKIINQNYSKEVVTKKYSDEINLIINE